MNLIRLVQAILTRALEREGYVNKTKLVKYLYLLDLEHYRRRGNTLTGFTWTFHLYGPWANDFEDLYAAMVSRGDINVRPGTRPDLDTEFLQAGERLDLTEIVDDVRLELAFRHIVDTWADRRLGEMLDYVYFHTEPMQLATRGSPLDFGVIERQAVSAETIRPAPVDRAAVHRMKRAIAERRAARQAPEPATFTPPLYDDHYFEALQIMDQDDGY